MADTYLTIDALNKLFQVLTMRMLGWYGSPPDYSKVRISWPTGGAPAWKLTDDVVFLRIMEEDDAYNRQRNVDIDTHDDYNANIITSYTRVMSANFICYGPNSFDTAQKIRDNLFYQGYHDTLAQSNLYMIPDIAGPSRMPELYDASWWERVDLKVKFNELIVRNLTVPYIEEVDFTIDNGEGYIEHVEIVAPITNP